MNMQRHYFIGTSLDELEDFEDQLEAAGISTPQIHVLSLDDAEVAKHQHLHEVQSVMKSDVVHTSFQGATIGAVLSLLILAAVQQFGWASSPTGWMPFLFLVVVLIGFCTWEGGLIGIQKPNYKFVRFEEVLAAGKHVFFVDLEPSQKLILDQLIKIHPNLEQAGIEKSHQYWLIVLQRKLGMARHS